MQASQLTCSLPQHVGTALSERRLRPRKCAPEGAGHQEMRRQDGDVNGGLTRRPARLPQVTVNEPGLDAVPKGVRTSISPVVASAGTIATICEAVSLTIRAGLPLKVTSVAFDRLIPWIVTDVSDGPELGEKLQIVGDDVRITLESDLTLTAQHSVVVVQETLSIPSSTPGVVAADHMLPPSVVASSAPVDDVVPPTVQQSEMVAHEIPLRD